mmetsp:Transcript_8736/g.21932  ORF Transcript_8736/g.21932 Transcript_8736/m.21932 type:complete len:241 (-) Transcript_8736:2498-3220(-)
MVVVGEGTDPDAPMSSSVAVDDAAVDGGAAAPSAVPFLSGSKGGTTVGAGGVGGDGVGLSEGSGILASALLPLQASGAAGLLLLSGCCLSPGDARAPELKLAVGLAAAAVVSGVAADEEGCDGGAPGLAAPAAADDDAGAGKRSGPAGDAARAPEARKKFASSGCVVGAGGGVEVWKGLLLLLLLLAGSVLEVGGFGAGAGASSSLSSSSFSCMKPMRPFLVWVFGRSTGSGFGASYSSA